ASRPTAPSRRRGGSRRCCTIRRWRATSRLPTTTGSRTTMGRRRQGTPIHGWLVLDKRAGMTSTQAVSAARSAIGAAKAGHGGTLDPLATGLLPVAFGEATKTVGYVMDGQKRYRFTVRWGEARSTDDAEGEVVAVSDRRPDAAAIRAALP